jgi:hypothetical protein
MTPPGNNGKGRCPQSTTNWMQNKQEKIMNTTNKKLIEVQDKKVILSTLWIVVMLSIKSADIIGFIEPRTLEKIIAGDLGFELTPTILLVFSLLQVLPILMVFVARTFRCDVNRWLNIIVSVLTLLYVLGGGNWESTSYYVFAVIETIAMLAIIWQGWNWRE